MSPADYSPDQPESLPDAVWIPLTRPQQAQLNTGGVIRVDITTEHGGPFVVLIRGQQYRVRIEQSDDND